MAMDVVVGFKGCRFGNATLGGGALSQSNPTEQWCCLNGASVVGSLALPLQFFAMSFFEQPGLSPWGKVLWPLQQEWAWR